MIQKDIKDLSKDTLYDRIIEIFGVDMNEDRHNDGMGYFYL